MAPDPAFRLLDLTERAVLLALCIGMVAALLFVALNGLTPLERPWTFGLVFLGWALLWYCAWIVPLLLLTWGASRLLRRGFVVRAALGLVGGASLLAMALLDRDAVVSVFALEGPDRFRRLTPVAFLAGGMAVLACAALPPGRRWWPRGLGLTALGAAFLALWPASEKQVVERSSPAATPRPRPPLVFVGIDGADWTLMEPLMARGELKVLAGLRERGLSGKLATIHPTYSPAIWTSILTGQPPERHGIQGFTSLRVAGVGGTLPPTRPLKSLGFAWFYRYLEMRGTIRKGTVTSNGRKVPAFWEIATANGSPVSVVNLWATWPAEPVLGSIVSERLHFWRQADRGHGPEQGRLTFPESLQEEVRTLVVAPLDVTHEDSRPFMDVTREEFEAMKGESVKQGTIGGEFKYLYSMFETERRIALHLIESSRRRFGVPADLLVLFRIVDLACHRALAPSELVQDHLGASPEDQRKFGRLVSEAYRRTDRALGEILAAFGDANVVVVSDHGFQREERKDKTSYNHRKGPPGILLVSGPAFRRGHVEGLGVYDVMPMLAYLKGFPVADDLAGKLREDVFAPSFQAAQPIVRVATYGRRGSVATAQSSTETDEEMLERLRALGYIQ